MNFENFFPAAEHLAGFLIVMVALTVLWALTGLLGRWFGRRDAETSSAEVASGPTDDDLVVAAATVAAMVDKPHRVISVRRQTSSPSREAGG